MERSLTGYSFLWESKDLSEVTWFRDRYYYGKTCVVGIQNENCLGFRVYFILR